MIRLGRALQSLLFARVSVAALLSRRADIFSSRQAIVQQLRKSLAIGGVALCGGKSGVTVNNMTDSESKQPPVGSEEERPAEASARVDPSTKLDEEKHESGLASASPGEKEEEKEEGVPNEATTSGTDSNDSKMDGVEMAVERARESDGTTIDEDKLKTDAKMTTVTLTKDETNCSDKTGSGVDKTPPPEEVDESTVTKEDTAQTKDDKHQAGTHPPKQRGLGSFFTSQVASMKRWFSQEPKRGTILLLRQNCHTVLLR